MKNLRLWLMALSMLTLFSAPAIEITDAVLAQLNQQVPSVSVTPLPQTQQNPNQGR